MCLAMEEMGLIVETHHHEVATAGQNEIGMKFNTLIKKRRAADLQVLRAQCAHAYGKTPPSCPSRSSVTTVPDARAHVTRQRRQEPVLGNEYAACRRSHSTTSAHYQARACTECHHNPLTNSYKRLVPGFEAPVMLAYRRATARPRSASRTCRTRRGGASKCASRIRVPTRTSRLRDDDGRPRRHPRTRSIRAKPRTRFVHLPPEEEKKIPTVCHALDQALDALDKTASS